MYEDERETKKRAKTMKKGQALGGKLTKQLSLLPQEVAVQPKADFGPTNLNIDSKKMSDDAMKPLPKPRQKVIKIIGKNGEQITMPMPDTDDPKEIKAAMI